MAGPPRRRRRSPRALLGLLDLALAAAALASLGRTSDRLAALTRSGASEATAIAPDEVGTNGTAAAPPPPPPVVAPLATAVLVETRCHPSFPVALHSAVRNLGREVPLVVIHSPRNADFVRGVLESNPELADAFVREGRIALRETREVDWGDPCPGNIHGAGCGVYSGDFWYSRMLTSLQFWERFETPYVLTLQSDALLCRPFPTGEMIARGASFTGGVSGMKRAGFQKYRVAPNPRNGTVLDGGEHLNGGMSFRDVRWAMDCIRTHGRPQGWIEDELYRRCREDDIDGTVHETEAGAYAWGSDNGVTLCFRDPNSGNRTCPLGVHKPWAQGVRKPGFYDELKRNCPGLHVLQTLSKHGLHRGENCWAHDLKGAVTNFRCNCPR